MPKTGVQPRTLPVWKKALFAAVPLVLLCLLAEGICLLLGFQPELSESDPFVGFAPSVPLFVEHRDASGRPVLVTAANKRGFFNPQQFPLNKDPSTFRIFCLGGSTTYGRPYADPTSFAGWLRELLPVAAPGQRWEVINAGGISYASYRVAALMEELAELEPDLFIVYSGHNEFLEERTYGELRNTPEALKFAYSVVVRTRTWAALTALKRRLGSAPAGHDETRTLMSREVKAKLDASAGPERYERDDDLRDDILGHYKFSLERMARIAKSAGAEVFFVTPASNLKDSSPFKSQHTDGLDEAGTRRSRERLESARTLLTQESWEGSVQALDEAIAIDPRHAELHFRRGQALFALARFAEAAAAFDRAREEDVCPLRVLGDMQAAVAEVARQAAAPMVDFPALLAGRSQSLRGHTIPGEEDFLDHVHPTIEASRLLAVALVEAMSERGLVRLDTGWGEEAIVSVAARVEGAITPEVHARALGNLALTLDWAGKREESQRLALRALDSGTEDPTIFMIVARHQALAGRSDEALATFLRALRANPGNPVVHSQLGMLRAERGELEAAAGHFFLATLLWEDNEFYHRQLATVMAQRGRLGVALQSLVAAKSLNPADPELEPRIADLRSRLGETAVVSRTEILTTRYPSGYPKTIAQARSSTGAGHGIRTEWFDGGGLKRYVDYVDGQPHGVSIEWDAEGRLVERIRYRSGRRQQPG